MKFFSLPLLLSVALLAGCTEAETRTGTVGGKVTLDGEPLESGTLLFMDDQGRADSAELGTGGTFELHLEPGTYKVSVAPAPSMDPVEVSEETREEKSPIPKKYHDFGTSQLTAEVKDGDSSLAFELKS